MQLRGITKTLNIQVSVDELQGFERLESAAIGTNCIYIQTQTYLDLSESHPTVDDIMETYKVQNIICLFI